MSDSIFNNVTINNEGGDPINLKVGSTAARVTFDNTGTSLSGTELQTVIQQVLGQNGYAVCDTAGDTAAKTATISNFVLRTGAKAVITFENENTAANPTLNISNTGAKAITVNSAAVGDGVIKAGYVFLVNYNGTSYDIVGGVGGDDGFFIGTTAQWEALTSAEKAEYNGKIVFITDDSLIADDNIWTRQTVIAPAETSPAAASHTEKDNNYFMYDNQLCKAIDDIDVGDILVEDTNYEIINVVEAFKGMGKDPVPTAYTILAANWNNGVYSFETIYPSTDYDIIGIYTNSTSTEEMRTAWAEADCGGYEATNIIKSHGTVPTIDLNVTLIIKEKS